MSLGVHAVRKLSVSLLSVVVLATLTAPALAQSDQSASYALVHGCYGLRSLSGGPTAGPYRLQATDLGRYLLYTTDGRFVSAADNGTVAPATDPSPAADFRVTATSPGAFSLSLPDRGGKVLVNRAGILSVVDASGATGDDAHFAFDQADGCPEYPEVGVNATGTPAKGVNPYAETRGLLDAHMHLMAFEFLGGDAHCGRPWSPYGAPYALAGCSGAAATAGNLVLDNALAKGGPGSYSDPVGWPTFKDWPEHGLLAHEQSYYKWLERAWMGGLRTYVNLFVDNEVLCNVYPVKRNPCNDMNSVRLENADLNKLQDYIDAQSGGPGKGWFRIVTDPFQARKVVNEGKLAVIKGIEVSRLFECGVNNDVPDCDDAKIDRELDEVYKLGVRDMEVVNKFDNAFGGVAGDDGTTGQITGVGNKLATGNFYQMETCQSDAQDRPPTALPGVARDQLIGSALAVFVPPGELPNYPSGSACNTRGLTTLGEHLIRQMMQRHMIVDPDHLDVISRSQVLSLLEAAHYSGVVSSHSWSDVQSLPRIFNLGGVVTPYAGDSSTFVAAWRKERELRSGGPYSFGWGYGADANGFGAQGGPRTSATNPVTYPFTGPLGDVTFDREVSGQRTFDINTDGVAHYGLYPDWIEDLRMQAGQPIVDDMLRGPEAYLQMWERADGVPLEQCRAARLRFTAKGTGRVNLGTDPETLLRSAGQVLSRPDRMWAYCVDGRRNAGKQVRSVFDTTGHTAFIASDAPGHRALSVGPGMAASKIKHAKAYGTTLRVRAIGTRGAKLVYGVRKGVVRFVGVASKAAGQDARTLRGYVKLVKLS